MPSVATAMICPPCFCAVKQGPGVPFQGHAAADPPAAASCGRSEPCRSLADVQRPTHGPWLVKLLYQGVLTDAVVVRYGSGAGAAGARAHDRL